MTQDCAELPRAVSIAPLRGGERLRGGEAAGKGRLQAPCQSPHAVRGEVPELVAQEVHWAGIHVHSHPVDGGTESDRGRARRQSRVAAPLARHACRRRRVDRVGRVGHEDAHPPAVRLPGHREGRRAAPCDEHGGHSPGGSSSQHESADPVRSSSAADAASVSSAALGSSSRLSSAAGAAWPFAAEPARRRRAAGGGDSP
mmetsp:Transcript_63979/g.175709  ORF Transcript_63979/g.175709 Transcript_63979/m.175709 type:complete len:200 (+) Transcript_63979:289-888(+)